MTRSDYDAMAGIQVLPDPIPTAGIYSLHSGGANVAMADGSVRFLSESIDFDELVRLFSRSGGPDE
jgi:prepilin-type processing-associated H-X9-DG protein